MTLNVCACADGIATATSASAKAVRRKLLCEIGVQCCAGFVMMVSCAGRGGWRQRFSMLGLYTQESDYFRKQAI